MIVIEHNLEIIKTSDWVIDLGPEGGVNGGRVVAVGTPEEISTAKQSFTGHFLKTVLSNYDKDKFYKSFFFHLLKMYHLPLYFYLSMLHRFQKLEYHKFYRILF